MLFFVHFPSETCFSQNLLCWIESIYFFDLKMTNLHQLRIYEKQKNVSQGGMPRVSREISLRNPPCELCER